MDRLLASHPDPPKAETAHKHKNGPRGDGGSGQEPTKINQQRCNTPPPNRFSGGKRKTWHLFRDGPTASAEPRSRVGASLFQDRLSEPIWTYGHPKLPTAPRGTAVFATKGAYQHAWRLGGVTLPSVPCPGRYTHRMPGLFADPSRWRAGIVSERDARGTRRPLRSGAGVIRLPRRQIDGVRNALPLTPARCD